MRGLSGTDAYAAAYPKATVENARKNAPRLTANDDIQAEIQRLRDKADLLGGSTVLTLVEMRQKLAAIVRTTNGELDGIQVRTADRLAAIKLDYDLSGIGGVTRGDLDIRVVIGGDGSTGGNAE